ncbi:TPA: YiaA/YiaB family inner membrane protein [Salmonella enterica subsp. salamae serovar 1,4,12,[27]:b:[e,n,x]]
MDSKTSTYSPAFNIVSWIALIGGIVAYLVGLWNATLLLSEKGFYGLAFFLSLFGAVAVQKNIRDGGFEQLKEPVVTAEDLTE